MGDILPRRVAVSGADACATPAWVLGPPPREGGSMRVLRACGGAVLWIVASVVSLVAVLLCATVVLLPIGIPLLLVGRRLFRQSIRLFLPRAARHPLKASGDAARSATQSATHSLAESLPGTVTDRVDGHKVRKQLRKR